MQYSSLGKEILRVDDLGTAEHFGDADSPQSAEQIAMALNQMSNPVVVVRGDPEFDYVAEARLTLSPQWHGEMVGKVNFVHALNDAIQSLMQLDKIKKTLFYGRDNNLEGGLGTMNLRALPEMIAGVDGKDSFANIIHGIIGVATEAGELLEHLRDVLNGKPIDPVNIREESGDIFWYIAILAKEGGWSFSDAEHINIAKLRARFPDKFTAYDANNRDLLKERGILEGVDYAAVQAGIDGSFVAENPLPGNEAHLPAHYRTAKMDGERHLDGEAIEKQKPY